MMPPLSVLIITPGFKLDERGCPWGGCDDDPVKKIFSTFVLQPNCLVLVDNDFFHFSVEYYLHILQGFLVCYVSKYCLRQCFCPIDDLAEALYHISYHASSTIYNPPNRVLFNFFFSSSVTLRIVPYPIFHQKWKEQYEIFWWQNNKYF